VPMITSPERRETLQFINRMEQAGVIDPDWKAQKEENFRLKWKGGKIGLFSEDWCATLCPQNYAGFAQANPKGVLQIIDPPLGPNGKSGAGTLNNAGQMYGLSKRAGDAGKGDGSTLDVFNDVLQRAAKLPKTDITPFAPLPPVPAERSADYTRTANEGAFQFAAGQRPFSEWDNYVQSVRAAGLDEWVAAAQQRGTEVGLLK